MILQTLVVYPFGANTDEWDGPIYPLSSGASNVIRGRGTVIEEPRLAVVYMHGYSQ